MVNQQTLNEISIRYWRNYLEKRVKNVKFWRHFLNLFSQGYVLEDLKLSLTTESLLTPVGKEGNSLFFLAADISDNNIIIKEIKKRKENFQKCEKKFKAVVIPSSEGIEFVLSISSGKNPIIEPMKIIRFPQGRISGYFLTLLELNSKQSVSKNLQLLSDISILESDYISSMLKSFKSIKKLILYSVILLLCSELTDLEALNDSLRKNFPSMKCLFEDILLFIQDSLIQKERRSDNIIIIKKIFNDLNIQNPIIDLNFLIGFLERYPFSLSEPSIVYREVAITPHILSIIIEHFMSSPSMKKKKGKYYTNLTEVEFITYLALYRFLGAKNPQINPEDLFDSIYNNWRSENKSSVKFANIAKSPSAIRILDPACGSGSFLVSISRLFGSLVTTEVIPNSISLEIWGNDIDSHAIAVTELRLFFLTFNDLSRNLKFPIQIDFHFVNENFFRSKVPYKFDLIVGNPPWIRHEDIGGGNLPNDKVLLKTRIKEIIGDQVSLDGKSDIYIYFCIMGLALLNKDGGVLAFLTSNAWLEVNYGKTLQNYLTLNQNGIETFEIIHWEGERLWNQLGINSVIFLAERQKTVKNLIQTQFRGVFTESFVNYSKIPINSLRKGIIPRKDYTDVYYRTEVIKQDQLMKTHKWAGTFLRTSRKERAIINKLSKRGVSLSSLADVRFGLKTGANDFFHLQPLEKDTQNKDYITVKNRAGYEGIIEREYLTPLIKTPTEVEGFNIPQSFTPFYWLFSCHYKRKRLKGSQALKYIEWAESEPVTIKQGLKSGTKVSGYSSIRSVQQRKFWYSIGEYTIPNLLWVKSYHVRVGCLLNEGRLLPDQRFYSINVRNSDLIPLIFTFLNSSLVWGQMEVFGNTNMGYGVLDTNVYWLKSLKIPLKAIEDSSKLHELERTLLKEKKRYSMFEFSQIRSDIDEFFSEYIGLSSEHLQILSTFILKTLSNRLKIPS
ncbi:MAG: Eco57I restriction-modification methylase domain-containing protein [Candidatus Hodarchaeota archaeon]